MMKVSDPIMFGHAVTAYYKDVFDKHAAVFDSLGVDPDNGIGDVYKKIQALPAETARRHRSRPSGRLRRPARARDGRFEQRDHQPSRPQRRDHRRVDAGRDPRLGTDVGPGRQAARHEGDDSRPLLRRHLPGDHRRLQAARRVRRPHHGHGFQRRADGAERRGIRIARQDVRDPVEGHRPRVRRQGTDALRARRRGRRHLAHVPDERSSDPGLGEAGRDARAGNRPCGDLLARREPGLRPERDRKGRTLPEGPRHVRSRHPDPVARRRDTGHADSGFGPGWTRFR